MSTIMEFDRISDEALLNEMQRLVASERQATARLVACLAEVDRRRLYLALGYTSLFGYYRPAQATAAGALQYSQAAGPEAARLCRGQGAVGRAWTNAATTGTRAPNAGVTSAADSRCAVVRGDVQSPVHASEGRA